MDESDWMSTDTDIQDGEQDSYDESTSDVFLSVFRLCCAVLFKAYEDLEDYDNPESPKYLYAQSAEDWIFNDPPAPLRFSFVCSILNLTMTEVREKATLIKQKKLSVKQLSPLKPSVKKEKKKSNHRRFSVN